jgi:hypothetical protein
MGKKCSVNDCQTAAKYSVHLSLAVHANHDPAISTALVYLCEEHKANADWNELNVDGNWDNICKSMEAAGRQAPVKEFSKVILEPLAK